MESKHNIRHSHYHSAENVTALGTIKIGPPLASWLARGFSQMSLARERVTEFMVEVCIVSMALRALFSAQRSMIGIKSTWFLATIFQRLLAYFTRENALVSQIIFSS